MKRLPLIAALLTAAVVQAAPVSYQIDPTHTYPSFEADHMGLSYWRGKLTKNTGGIVYDKADGSGSVDVQMDLAGIDFGLAAMNEWARGKEFLDVDQHPTASFKGRFAGASGGMPSQVVGELTLNGRTRPMTLSTHRLTGSPHPLYTRELCGADASGHYTREDFGLAAGKDWGFDMDVQLRIQVEAIAKE